MSQTQTPKDSGSNNNVAHRKEEEQHPSNGSASSSSGSGSSSSGSGSSSSGSGSSSSGSGTGTTSAASPATAQDAASPVTVEADEEASPEMERQMTNSLLGRDFSTEFKMNINWYNLRYTVDGREILKGLCGRAIAGRSLAIMGSSGAGKTTFLNAIAGRLAADHRKVLTGDIRLNDIPNSEKYRRLMGFVPQDDILAGMSTPDSALRFTVRVRLGVTSDEAQIAADEMITKLKLVDCRDTRVGIPGVIAGLSGGERKRLNIGTELIADTKLLLCDEPTSGLDSNTSLSVVRTLGEIAREGNRTVMFTIHQPTHSMTKLFDDILLLTGGHVAYHGPMSHCTAYFGKIGFPCPATYTPTDHFMVLLQNPAIADILVDNWGRFLSLNGIERPLAEKTKKRRRLFRRRQHTEEVEDVTSEMANRAPSHHEPHEEHAERLGSDDTTSDDDDKDDDDQPSAPHDDGEKDLAEKMLPAHVRAMRDNYTPCPDDVIKTALPTHSVMVDRPAEDPDSSNPTVEFIDHYQRATKPSWKIQWLEVFKRTVWFTYTDWHFLAATLMQILVFSVIAGLIFFNLENSITGVQDRFGLFFMVVMSGAMSNAMGVVNRFKPLRELYVREQQSGSYPVVCYFICTFIADIPLFAVMAMIQSIMIYFMTDLYRSAHNFFYFYAVLYCMFQMGLSLGSAMSSLIQNDLIINAANPCIIIPMMLVGGLLATNSQIRPYWIWLEKLSFIRYGFLLLVHLEFPELTYLDCDREKFGDSCNEQPKTGSEYIAYMGWDDVQDSAWVMWLEMACMFVLLRIINLIGLYITANTKF